MQRLAGMSKYLAVAILLTTFLIGCASKAAPKSTTTTSTQTTVESEDGSSTSTDVTEKRVEQADGTQDVEHTETVKQTIPATPPPTP